MKSIRVALLASILAIAVAGTSVVPVRADQAAGGSQTSDQVKKPTKKKMVKKTKKAKKKKAKKTAAPAAGQTKTQ